jgi:hypothetical protein
MAIREKLMQAAVKLTDGLCRLWCQPDGVRKRPVVEEPELPELEGERRQLSTGSAEQGEHLREELPGTERVEQGDVWHPAADFAVVLAAQSLNRLPEFLRGDEDERGRMGLAGAHQRTALVKTSTARMRTGR